MVEWRAFEVTMNDLGQRGVGCPGRLGDLSLDPQESNDLGKTTTEIYLAAFRSCAEIV
jgi:hypothetical protein